MTAEKSKLPAYHGMNIHQRLHAVMQEVDYIQKSEKTVNNQYRFVSHDAVTAKCRAAFLKHGVLSVPTIIGHSTEWGSRKKKAWVNKVESLIDEPILRTTVQLQVAFVNIDKPDETVVTISYGYGLDDQDKGIGKAYSYAVKYAYLKVLGLETGDDPDTEEVEDIGKRPEQALTMGGDNSAEYAGKPFKTSKDAKDWMLMVKTKLDHAINTDDEDMVDSLLEEHGKTFNHLLAGQKKAMNDLFNEAKMSFQKQKMNGAH